MTTYLTKEVCLSILKKCVATSVKNLYEINELKKNTGNEDEIDFLTNEIIGINKIMESVNNYITIADFD
jgi:hypothetical protein